MNAMRAHLPSFVVILALAMGGSSLAQIQSESDCHMAREKYSALNQELNEEADGTPEDLKNGTDALVQFITHITHTRLQDSSDARKIQAYLNCAEWAKDELGAEEFTNAPQVELIRTPVPLATASSLLLRGGFGMQDRPLLQCFAKAGLRWRLVGQNRENFNGHTFNTYRIRSPFSGEVWTLLSGKVIGSTGADMSLEIVSCSAKRLRSVWSRNRIVRGGIVVHPTRVELTFSKSVDQARKLPSNWQMGPSAIIQDKRTENPVVFKQTLRVTRKGLEP